MAFLARHKNIFPLLVLVALIARCYFIILLTKFASDSRLYTLALTNKHIGALVAVLLCAIAYFFFRQWYKYVLGTTLLLGTLSVLNFNVNEHTWFASLGILKIVVQPLILALTLVTIIMNYQAIRRFLRKVWY